MPPTYSDRELRAHIFHLSTSQDLPRYQIIGGIDMATRNVEVKESTIPTTYSDRELRAHIFHLSTSQDLPLYQAIVEVYDAWTCRSGLYDPTIGFIDGGRIVNGREHYPHIPYLIAQTCRKPRPSLEQT